MSPTSLSIVLLLLLALNPRPTCTRAQGLAHPPRLLTLAVALALSSLWPIPALYRQFLKLARETVDDEEGAGGEEELRRSKRGGGGLASPPEEQLEQASHRDVGRVVTCDECGVLRPPQRGGKPRHWTCDTCYFGPEEEDGPDGEVADAAEVRRSGRGRPSEELPPRLAGGGPTGPLEEYEGSLEEPRRSRRDRPALAAGRRVRATFVVDRRPTWFFGVVQGSAEDGMWEVIADCHPPLHWLPP